MTDGDSNLSLTFFRRPFGSKIKTGAVGLFWFKVSYFRGIRSSHPECHMLDGDDLDPETAASYANGSFPCIRQLGLSSWAISKAIRIAIDQVDWDSQPDPIPADVRQRHGLLAMADAYRGVHRPNTIEESRAGNSVSAGRSPRAADGVVGAP